MKTWVKVLLAILAFSLVTCGIGIAGVTYWFNQNAGALKAKGDKMKAEAQAFANNHTADECIDEGFRRLAADTGFMGNIEANVFTTACASAAEKPAGFCDGVPSMKEIMATVNWRVATCAAKGMPESQPCQRLLESWQKACHTSASP
jgi:hypothetical protein